MSSSYFLSAPWPSLPSLQRKAISRPSQNRRIVASNIHSMSLMIGSSRLLQGLTRQQHADGSPSGLLLPRQLARQQQQQQSVQLPNLQQRSSHSRQVDRGWIAPQFIPLRLRSHSSSGAIRLFWLSGSPVHLHAMLLVFLRPTVAAQGLRKGTHAADKLLLLLPPLIGWPSSNRAS